MNFTITRNQWILILFIGIVMAADAIISLDGAWNHNAIFYEANPILAAFNTVVTFTAAVLILKIVAILVVIWTVSCLNVEPGEHWGTMAAAGGLISTSCLIGTITVLNFII